MQKPLLKRIVIFVFALTLVFFLLGQGQNQKEKLDSQNIDLKVEREKIEKILKKEGGKQAYEYFKQRFGGSSSEHYHDFAHFIGNALYVHEGAGGIIYCGQELNWGCFHGFFGAAISSEGKEFLTRAADICGKDQKTPLDFGGCLHGIGHGVLAMEGYELKDLIAALGDCDLLKGDLSLGCYNGAFMEFNTRTMFDSQPRNYDPLKPYYPCDSIPSSYQADCFYELPAWWRTRLLDNFSQMGSLCLGLREEKSERCFRGIGRIARDEKAYDESKISRVCGLMPRRGRAACIKEAIRMQSIADNKSYLGLCAILDTKAEEQCIIESREYLCRVINICQ